MTPLQNQLINKIMTSKVIDGGLLEEAAELIVTSLISGLEIKRAGIWIYQDDQRDIINAYLVIDHQHQIRDTTIVLTRKEYPTYFSALDEEIVIKADDATTNPLTSEFRYGYLDVLNIQSMLDAPIRINGTTVGVVCCEHIGDAQSWSEDAVLFASLLADQFGRTMAAAEKIAQYEQLQKTSRALDEQTNRLKALHASLNRFSLISTTDLKGRITEVNDNFLSITQYNRDEIVGQSQNVFVSGYHDSKFFAEMWHTLEKGHIWQGRICNRKKHGELFWVDATISPVKNLLGKIEGYIGLYYEITHEVDTENQLNEAEKLSKMGSFRCNVHTNLWICSPNLKQMFNLTESQMVTWSHLESMVSVADFYSFKKTFDALEENQQLNVIVSLSIDPDVWFHFTARRQGVWIIGSCQDISSRIQQDQKLNEIIALQHTILDSANFTVIATKPDGTITHFNHMAEKLLGYQADEVVNHYTPSTFHLRDEIKKYALELSRESDQPVPIGFEALVAKACTGIVDEKEWTYIAKNGVTFPVSLSVTAIFDDSNKIVGYLGIGKDLTEQKKAERYSAQLQKIMTTAGDIATFSGFLYDVSRAEFHVTNEQFRSLISRNNTHSKIHFEQIQEFFPEHEKLKLIEALENAIRFGTEFDIRVETQEPRSTSIEWMRVVGTPQYDGDEVTSVLGFIQDMTSQIHLEEKLSSLALTDELTKVPNRRALMAQLSDEWKRYIRYQNMASVLIMDIDYFKKVNDKWGHDAGDFALESVSVVILDLLRESDMFGRLGGEEFLVIAPNGDERSALQLAEKLREAVESTTISYTPPFQTSSVEMQITMSIGVCGLSHKITSVNKWLVAADKALYAAKQGGRNQVIAYSDLPDASL